MWFCVVQGRCGAGERGAVWCSVVQGGRGAGECSARQRWCRQVWCSVVQGECGVVSVVQKCVQSVVQGMAMVHNKVQGVVQVECGAGYGAEACCVQGIV